MKTYLLYGLHQGVNDPSKEIWLGELLTEEQLEKTKATAASKGLHSFRVSVQEMTTVKKKPIQIQPLDISQDEWIENCERIFGGNPKNK